MGRPRIYDTPHFNFYTYVQKGNAYVGAYTNKWNPEKKRSEIAKRKYVGTLDTTTGRVRLGKKYLSEHPEYEGKILYYEDKKLVERDPAAVEEEIKEREETLINDVVSYGASLAAWKIAEKAGMLQDLTEIYGKDLAATLMQLAIYQLLDGGSFDCYENWICQNWLPQPKILDGRRISEALAKVNRQSITDYMKLRNTRCAENFEKLKESDAPAAQKVPKYRYLALDSTAISTYSMTINDAAYGHAKQNPELEQVNFTLGVDYLSGDVCYAYESEGSINDKALYPHLLLDMKNNGYELKDTVLVTDRGYESIYNIQRLLNVDVNYVCGVPLSENSVKALFNKHKASLDDPAFLNGNLEVSARTVEENWHRQTEYGELSLKASLHLYKYPLLAAGQVISLQKQIENVLLKKDQGLTVHSEDWNAVKKYICENKDKQWVKNHNQLSEYLTTAGCFAIRSNCINDPFECLSLYKQRQIVETAFRQMKVAIGANRFRCTQTSYIGKLLVFVLVQSIRMKMYFTVKANQQVKTIKLPGDSLDKAQAILKGLMAVRPPSKAIWTGRPISKKARDVLELFGIEKNFPRNLKL